MWDEIWMSEAGMEEMQDESDRQERPPLYLCIGCLEARIGRRLSASDFTEYPVNSPSVLSSPRLNQRLVGWGGINTERKLEIAERNEDERLCEWLRCHLSSDQR